MMSLAVPVRVGGRSAESGGKAVTKRRRRAIRDERERILVGSGGSRLSKKIK